MAGGGVRYTVHWPSRGFVCKVLPVALKERPHTHVKVVDYFEERAREG